LKWDVSMILKSPAQRDSWLACGSGEVVGKEIDKLLCLQFWFLTR
jgi:hypothetical protein